MSCQLIEGVSMKRLKFVPEGSRILQGFEMVDWCESCQISAASDKTPKQIAAIAFALPPWFALLMRLRHWVVRPLGLKTDGGTELLFPIIEESANEIVMGMTDRHLDFRVSVLKDAENSCAYLTTVVHKHNNLGTVYFFFIRPFHVLTSPSLYKRAES